MRHIILLSGGVESPANGLLGALRDAGISALTGETAGHELGRENSAAGGAHEAGKPAPLAVVLDIAAGTNVADLHTIVTRATSSWPDTPLVACRRNALEDGHPAAQPLDASTLKRLGFHAVADEPAQLPAVLHELESQGTLEDAPATEGQVAPASLLLPEKLSTERLRAAFEMVASLHLAADQKGAAATAMTGLATLVRAARWTIYLVTEAGRRGETTFEPLAARGLTASERELPEGDWRRALIGDALALSGAQSQAAYTAVAQAETVRRREGNRRVIAVPLLSGDRTVGVLEAVREGEGERAFSDADAALLSALSLPLSAALSNAVRIAEAERLSQTDDLTKLHNARFLRQFLTGELKRARRYGSPVSAMFLDLDDFKNVNDHYGHLVGSHVLMETAAVVVASVRDTDVVARYGGDEFVAILPETADEQAARVAERVRERISNHTFTGGRSLRLRLTASFGVSTFPLHAQSPQQLIASADAAMYEAKAARKNCVRFAVQTS